MKRRSEDIYLDDVRNPPGRGWHVIRCVALLKSMIVGLGVSNESYDIHLSLDHDLGEDEPTGYDFLNWLEAMIVAGSFKNLIFNFSVHSANPVGRDNMRRAIDSIKRKHSC